MTGSVEVSSLLDASVDDVWDRVITPDGINHELGPWLRMTVPSALKGATVDTVTVGVPLGRSWVLALGFVPVDFDDLCIAELGERHFVERSRLMSMRVWQHERAVTPEGDACRVSDRLTFEARALLRVIPGGTRAASAIVRRIFEHRHRRLRAYFGGRPLQERL